MKKSKNTVHFYVVETALLAECFEWFEKEGHAKYLLFAVLEHPPEDGWDGDVHIYTQRWISRQSWTSRKAAVKEAQRHKMSNPRGAFYFRRGWETC